MLAGSLKAGRYRGWEEVQYRQRGHYSEARNESGKQEYLTRKQLQRRTSRKPACSYSKMTCSP